jgi:membrane protein DedA with SNARE-associated domain
MRYYLRLLSLPLLFFFLYATLFLAWRIFDLPSPEAMTQIVDGWFNEYGLPALFVCSILEGLLLIGGYFPGVFVIFIGVVLADSPMEALLAMTVATAGLLISHIVNYLLGKYGWYKLLVKFGMRGAIEESKRKMEKRGPIAIPLSYWLPSIGALTNTAAGILQLRFRTFILYSVASSVFWYSIVGILVYLLGDKAISLSVGNSGMAVAFGIVAVWMLILLIMDKREKNSNTPLSDLG